MEAAGMAEASMVLVGMNGPQWLSLETGVPGVAPEKLLEWFLDPERLARWWSPSAVVEPRAGGRWEMGFPQIGGTLAGQIADITPTSLVVSWAWDNEPDLPARSLIVRAEPGDGGARLRIVHGPYRPGSALPREDEDRESHLEGWRFFLPRLVRAVSSP